MGQLLIARRSARNASVCYRDKRVDREFKTQAEGHRRTQAGMEEEQNKEDLLVLVRRLEVRAQHARAPFFARVPGTLRRVFAFLCH